jgi:uncharacterized membrane protein (DUF485 family)
MNITTLFAVTFLNVAPAFVTIALVLGFVVMIVSTLITTIRYLFLVPRYGHKEALNRCLGQHWS